MVNKKLENNKEVCDYMGIDDYTLNGGINSRIEEILATGLNATPESIQGLIVELKNRNYESDLEYLLGCQLIELLKQRLNSQGTSEVIMGYQEDLRDAISALQSRLDDLYAGGQSDLNGIQSALNTLQTTVDSLSTTVQGKASTTDVNDALALKADKSALDTKADKTEIVDPTWGEIEGSLSNQTDLTNALSGKASTSDLAGIDTRVGTLEDTITTKADKSALDAKADKTEIVDPTWGQIKGSLSNQTDLVNALSGKASTSDLAGVDTRTRTLENTITTKADKSALDAKADKTEVSNLSATVDTKASASALSNLSTTVSNLSTTVSNLNTTVNTKASASDLSNLSTTVSNLSTTVGTKAVVKYFIGNLSASGWSSSKPYTQTVSISGVLNTDKPKADIILSSTTATALNEIESWACVSKIIAGNNSITATCLDKKPTVNMSVQLEVLR